MSGTNQGGRAIGHRRRIEDHEVGGYLIPRGFGASIAATGGPYLALEVFLAFYVTCIWLNWWYYMRKTTIFAKANV